jgi:hypothetical protein
MKYNYICPECDNEVTKEHRIIDSPRILCTCGGVMEKSFKDWGSAPLVRWDKPPDTASAGKECKK